MGIGGLFFVQIIAVIKVAGGSEGREESVPHQRDAGLIEIQVAGEVEERRVVGSGKHHRLRTLVVGGYHLLPGKHESLRLAVERHNIRAVVLGYQSGLQASPERTAEVAFLDLGDIECLFASDSRAEVG